MPTRTYARFTKPLQIVATPAMAAAIEKMAEAEQVSRATIYRRLLVKGLAAEGVTV